VANDGETVNEILFVCLAAYTLPSEEAHRNLPRSVFYADSILHDGLEWKHIEKHPNTMNQRDKDWDKFIK
jgi:hypothetical protein